MSQIFNIVEELEKERKKNKELEERIDKTIKFIETNYFITGRIKDIYVLLKGDNK